MIFDLGSKNPPVKIFEVTNEVNIWLKPNQIKK
jgi:hypothetical protein